MDYRVINPYLGYWVEYKLEKDIIDFLWERIDDAKKINLSHKNSLAGNISRSLRL